VTDPDETRSSRGSATSNLIDTAIEAHGGLERWNELHS
jgi:hypothetical protein